jgi:hypothetical protein
MSPTTLNDINVSTRPQLEANLAKAKDEFFTSLSTAHRIVLYNAVHELGKFVVRMIGEHIAVYDFALKTAQAVLRLSIADGDMDSDKFTFNLNAAKVTLQLALRGYDEDSDLYRCGRALDISGFDFIELNIAFSNIHNKRDEVWSLLLSLEESLSPKS